MVAIAWLYEYNAGLVLGDGLGDTRSAIGAKEVLWPTYMNSYIYDDEKFSRLSAHT